MTCATLHQGGQDPLAIPVGRLHPTRMIPPRHDDSKNQRIAPGGHPDDPAGRPQGSSLLLDSRSPWLLH
ncbi:MAG: hypothetical protein E6J48_04020 [Chloroflexi bacterium]|nr:MAG: hypothetical protein E6J48_04020 [Chloroflexota bacterium]TMD40479.1 MAG: hypothetical protein E6I90_14615 [Chloroflexota bacterium]